MSTCSLYLTQNSCTTSAASGTAAKCAWSGTACNAVATTSTDCAYVTGTGLTDAICITYNVGCTANKAGTACQEKKATCSAYTVSTACSTSSASGTAAKCVWGGATPACLAVTTIATHCAYITGIGLTDAICATYNTGCGAVKDGTGC